MVQLLYLTIYLTGVTVKALQCVSLQRRKRKKEKKNHLRDSTQHLKCFV